MTRKRYHNAYDNFTGRQIGTYETLEGKAGLVLQQEGTKVVHVYGVHRLAELGEPFPGFYREKRLPDEGMTPPPVMKHTNIQDGETLNVWAEANRGIAEVMGNVKEHLKRHKGKVNAPFSTSGMQTIVKHIALLEPLEKALLAWVEFGPGADEGELYDAACNYFGIKQGDKTDGKR